MPETDVESEAREALLTIKRTFAILGLVVSLVFGWVAADQRAWLLMGLWVAGWTCAGVEEWCRQKARV